MAEGGVCVLVGEELMCLIVDLDRVGLVVSVSTLEEENLLTLSSSFCFSFSFSFSRTSMTATAGTPSSLYSLIVVVICLGLVCFCLLEVVVSGLVPVNLWTVLCVVGVFEVGSPASCRGEVCGAWC